MRIASLFAKDIFRPINGVVKADQLDASSVWQELDEFVVTRELDKHLERFISSYCAALDDGKNPEVAQKIGVWVSGFFGSGKSHFVKVLSYLLDNREHSYEGETKRAVDFFDSKIADTMLLADIKRAAASDTDVVLFNIDSKADSRSGRDAILSVFLKVFNELQGFSGDHPHIAHLERYLSRKGKLEEFHAAFNESSKAQWTEERDAWAFHRDEVIQALASTLGQSAASCEKWVDGAEESFSLSIENFAKWVQEYLDARGPEHRIIFLVDEVGQFIGADSHLMLNLQTITEELGTLCRGRAWIVVTSQEDIDAALGEVRTAKAEDFSKIQGRFRTRLSLSSANVDEVIQERLLAKREDAVPELVAIFDQKGDILKNQLTFKNIGMTFRQFKDGEDFARNYPFAPYQFKLLQKIFESIRKAGATGLHLAQGERSLLDAFQSAGKAVANHETGILVPLYRFYPAIESFLDTAVKRTIDHARDNQSLEPFDAHVLEVLFLIRYVDEIKGNVENLVTLCLDEIDGDRLALRKATEASLQRLEKETLISRNGEDYFFLTDEERDINREIKNVELSSGEEAKLLGQIIFDDIFKEQRKHRYSENKNDFTLNRSCDMHPLGHRAEGGLAVSVISPLADSYELLQSSQCILDSQQDGGQVLIRLGDREALGREVRILLKTDKYVRTKDDGTLPPATKRIHRDLADDNRQRRERLASLLHDMVVEADYFVAGQKLAPKASGAPLVLAEALEYLIKNTFTKMGYIRQLRENPLQEIQAVLRGDDVEQRMLDLTLAENNPQAADDLRSYIELCTKTSKKLVLHDLVTARYANRPYGWPSLETVLLLARLHAAGEIQFLRDNKPIPADKVYEAITTPNQWRKILIDQRVAPPAELIQKARDLGKQVFSEMGPDGEMALFEFLREKLGAWREDLLQHKSLADTGNYPGKQEIDDGLGLIKTLLALDDSTKLIPRVTEFRAELLELSARFHDLDHFYRHQKPTWDKLHSAHEKFSLNRAQLYSDDAARAAMERMSEILETPAPYGALKETEGLVKTVREVDERFLASARATARKAIADQRQLVIADLATAGSPDGLREECLRPFEALDDSVGSMESLAHISQAEQQAVALKERAVERVEEFLAAASGSEEPKIKKTIILKVSELAGKGYLESEEEVGDFLQRLKERLLVAVEKKQRIEIR